MVGCGTCGAPLPADARFCPSCAAPVAAAPLGDERKLATVVFADLVDSTRLGEQDPERTRMLLERFYDAMAAEITDTGGTVEKFAGDAVMAVFGAPVAQEDHAERALHASLSMLRRLTELFDGRLRLRIGVNTGEVVVGRPREGSSFVTGDAVNVAARLEQAAESGEVLVGERTVSVAGSAFEFGPPRHITAKGKTDEVACRSLHRALAMSRPRGVSGLGTAFVGRDSELDLLRSTFQRACADGRPHLVTISADPGVGKSRLVKEFGSWLRGRPSPPLIRSGRCPAYGDGITYWALGEILKEHLGLYDTDSFDAVRTSLQGRETLALTLGLDPGLDVHPLVARDRLQEAWVAFVDDLAAEQPVVLLVEDVHWAEEPLLGLLERLVRGVSGPLLLLTTTRPELQDTQPWWGRGRNAATIWLEPLSDDVTDSLCRQLLGIELPGELRDAIVETAEGNPFYVEELIASLIDNGTLSHVGDVWIATGGGQRFVAPDSVQSILAARIDLLPAAEKLALQTASVVGRVFWDGPVRHLLGDVEPDFALLEERDFIRRHPTSSLPGEREFLIKHALTREVAYSSLPRAQRARLHAGFAGWLEAGVGENEPLFGVVAHHYAESVRPEDADLAWSDRPEEFARLRGLAVRWLRRAAGVALPRYLVDDALVMLHRARELAAGPQQEGEIWQEIGHAYAMKYDGEAFWAAMARALELTPREDHAPIYAELAFVTAMKGGMFPTRPDPEQVRHWADQVLELTDSPPLRVRAHLARAGWLPELDDRLQELAVAIPLAQSTGEAEVLLLAHCVGMDCALESLDLELYGSHLRAALDLSGTVTDPDVRSEVTVSEYIGVLLRGDFPRALETVREHRGMVDGLTSHHRVHGLAHEVQLGDLLGRWDDVRALAPEVERTVAANAETPCVLSTVMTLTCALAAELLGDPEESRRLEAVADGLASRGFSSIAMVRARLALARGDTGAATRLVDTFDPRESVVSLFGTGLRFIETLAAVGRDEAVEELSGGLLVPGSYPEPFALWALGRVRGDAALVQRAVDRFAELGLDWYAERSRTDLATIRAG